MYAGKKTALYQKQILEIIEKYPTPFHIYDEKAIRKNAREFKKAFAWNKGFKEYFAVKACPNPYIMKILQAEGFGADCSSLAELVMSEKPVSAVRKSCFPPMTHRPRIL